MTAWIPDCGKPVGDATCSLVTGHRGECFDLVGAVRDAPAGPMVPIPGHPGAYTQVVDVTWP